jgi:hypothetical protein
MGNIREAFEYAAKNPNSDFAKNLKSLAESGALNVEAKKFGIDLSSFQEKEEPGIVQSVVQGVASPFLRAGATLGAAADNAQAAYNIGVGMIQGDQEQIAKGQQQKREAETKAKAGVDLGYLGNVKPLQGINDDGSLDAKTLATDIVGTGAQAASTVLPAAKGKILSKVLTGAGSGYVSDVANNLNDPNVQGLDNLTPGSGTVIGGALPVVGKALGKPGQIYKNYTAKSAQVAEEKANKLIGTVIQGKTGDIAKAKAALSSIEISNIKTYKDLHNAFDDQIRVVAKALDSQLDTVTTRHTLGNLAYSSKVGDKVIAHNYVQDALAHLDELYIKTNDPVSKAEIGELIQKAQKEGLTVTEINNLARLYGSEFSSKAFSKVSGEALTGVNAQAFENTRSGIKATARSLFGGESFATADEQISNLIRARDLSNQLVEKVNQLKQKVTERGLGEKIGRLVFQVTDKFTGGGLKGFIQSFVPRGEGLKVMNALDLEKNLSKNLKIIEEILNQDVPEKTLIQKLQSLLGVSATKSKQFGKDVAAALKDGSVGLQTKQITRTSNPLEDTGDAYLNRLNKYETQRLNQRKTTKKQPSKAAKTTAKLIAGGSVVAASQGKKKQSGNK